MAYIENNLSITQETDTKQETSKLEQTLITQKEETQTGVINDLNTENIEPLEENNSPIVISNTSVSPHIIIKDLQFEYQNINQETMLDTIEEIILNDEIFTIEKNEDQEISLEKKPPTIKEENVRIKGKIYTIEYNEKEIKFHQ